MICELKLNEPLLNLHTFIIRFFNLMRILISLINLYILYPYQLVILSILISYLSSLLDELLLSLFLNIHSMESYLISYRIREDIHSSHFIMNFLLMPYINLYKYHHKLIWLWELFLIKTHFILCW
jgi:hypothetical protein